jgi:hypothetical protein
MGFSLRRSLISVRKTRSGFDGCRDSYPGMIFRGGF